MGLHGDRHALIEVFGKTDGNLPDLPEKVGNVKVARVLHGDAMGCSWCFPHGFESGNATWNKNRRSWKHYRKHQYRDVRVP